MTRLSKKPKDNCKKHPSSKKGLLGVFKDAFECKSVDAKIPSEDDLIDLLEKMPNSRIPPIFNRPEFPSRPKSFIMEEYIKEKRKDHNIHLSISGKYPDLENDLLVQQWLCQMEVELEELIKTRIRAFELEIYS